MSVEKADEEYLGDGLYASFDGDQIKLRAPHGRMPDGMVVYLEREVFTALCKFAQWKCWQPAVEPPKLMPDEKRAPLGDEEVF